MAVGVEHRQAIVEKGARRLAAPVIHHPGSIIGGPGSGGQKQEEDSRKEPQDRPGQAAHGVQSHTWANVSRRPSSSVTFAITSRAPTAAAGSTAARRVGTEGSSMGSARGS